MNVIPPLEIIDAMLTSSTAAEPGPGETLWDSLTNYSVGDEVYREENHTRYRNQIAGTDATPPEDAPDRWKKLGPTNKFAMFDTYRNTATVLPSSITVVLTPGERVDSIGLAGLVANSVTVSMTSDGDTVYNHTEDLNTREVFNWYDYFFKPFTTKKSVALFDLPPYTNGVITVIITATSGNAECGACVLGMYEYIGDVQYEAESDAPSFAKINRDEFAQAELIPRPNVPKTIQNIWLEKSRVNRARALRDSLNARPAFWAGLHDSGDGYFEALLILGIYRRFVINLRHPEHAVISLELEEI